MSRTASAELREPRSPGAVEWKHAVNFGLGVLNAEAGHLDPKRRLVVARRAATWFVNLHGGSFLPSSPEWVRMYLDQLEMEVRPADASVAPAKPYETTVRQSAPALTRKAVRLKRPLGHRLHELSYFFCSRAERDDRVLSDIYGARDDLAEALQDGDVWRTRLVAWGLRSRILTIFVTSPITRLLGAIVKGLLGRIGPPRLGS